MKNLKVEDSGAYEFTATKGDSSKTVAFSLNVLIPQEPQFKVTAVATEVACNPKKLKNTCRLYFDIESLEGKVSHHVFVMNYINLDNLNN